jgi:hypothetical protein
LTSRSREAMSVTVGIYLIIALPQLAKGVNI